MNEQIRLVDIAGYEDEKEEALKIIEVLKNHEKYEKMGAYVPKGLILSGNPGVGKTMLAKAIATESGVPLFEFESDETASDAKTVKSLKEIFEKARNNAPAIVFIDELDELVMTEDYMSDFSRKTLKILLTEIDGIKSTDGIIVIATTNYKAKLPPSLLRSGRMDKKITIEMPDLKSREAIFNLYLSKNEYLKNVDAKKLAAKTSDFSGADIKNLINEVIIDCAAKHIEKITLKDFERIIPVVLFQNIRKSNPNGPDQITCYHEIGHWVVGYHAFGDIGTITTERYGNIAGHVIYEDVYDDRPEPVRRGTLSLKTLDRHLQVKLAGLAAEEVFCDDRTTGCSSDISTAKRMIRSLAASGAFGFGISDPEPDVGRGMRMMIASSQERMAKLEELEEDKLNKAFQEAKRILENNRELVEAIYVELKEKRKLSKEEMEEFLEEFNKKHNEQEGE